jgi:hypothetical protein
LRICSSYLSTINTKALSSLQNCSIALKIKDKLINLSNLVGNHTPILITLNSWRLKNILTIPTTYDHRPKNQKNEKSGFGQTGGALALFASFWVSFFVSYTVKQVLNSGW